MKKNKQFLTLLVVTIALVTSYFMFSVIFGNGESTEAQQVSQEQGVSSQIPSAISDKQNI